MNPISTDSDRSAAADSAGEWTAFDLLADRRRRTTLHYLNETGKGATLTEIAEEIARREVETEMGASSDHAGVTSDRLWRIRISLHHRHLPKLAEVGAVDYDPATKTVELRDRGRRLLDRLGAVRGPPWAM